MKKEGSMRTLSMFILCLGHAFIFAQTPGKAVKAVFPRQQVRYSSTFGEVQTDVSTNGTTLQVSNEGERFLYVQSLQEQNDGLYLTRVHQRYKLFGLLTRESITTYKAPLHRFPKELKTGITWNSGTMEYSGGDSALIQLTGRVAGEETIVTKAGTYHAFRLETVFSHPGGEQSKVIDWIAPDAGIVKTTVQLSGDGLMGVLKRFLGYGELTFELSFAGQLQ